MKTNLRALGIQKIKTVPYTLISHPFFERLTGAVHRELRDEMPFWNSVDLESKLSGFEYYCKHQRIHADYNDKTSVKSNLKSLKLAHLVGKITVEYYLHCLV